MSQQCAEEKVFQLQPDGFYFLGIDWGGRGRAGMDGGAEACSLGKSWWPSRPPWGPVA